MSEYKEKISAFLDDAAQPAELDALEQSLGHAESHKEGLGVISRYQMIGEAVRGEVNDLAFIDVSAQVRQALAADTYEGVTHKVSLIAQLKHSFADLSAWHRPVGGFAVAATVALVMVLAVIQENPEQVGSPMAGAQVATKNSNTQPIESIPVAVAVAVAPDMKADADNRSGIGLDAYLAEHAEFAAQDTMMGRMPYVRAVSYESK